MTHRSKRSQEIDLTIGRLNVTKVVSHRADLRDLYPTLPLHL